MKRGKMSRIPYQSISSIQNIFLKISQSVLLEIFKIIKKAITLIYGTPERSQIFYNQLSVLKRVVHLSEGYIISKF